MFDWWKQILFDAMLSTFVLGLFIGAIVTATFFINWVIGLCLIGAFLLIGFGAWLSS